MASPIITPMPVQTDTDYRPISRMAVIGLILALPSTLIFASDSLFWILFVVAIPAFIICCVAWKSIRNSQGNLAGESLAVLGIVISVASGLGWLTMTTVSNYITEIEARAATDDFLAKLQKGEAGAAFLLKAPASARLIDFNPEEHGRLRRQFPGPKPELSDFDAFLLDDVCGQILRYGDQVKVGYNGLVETKIYRESPIYRFSYHYESPARRGMFVLAARAEDYDGKDGVRREWVVSIDNIPGMFQDSAYGEQLRMHEARATEAVEKFIFTVANPDDHALIEKIVDPKNQGDLQTVIGYIRPKGKVGAINQIDIRKPLRLRADKKTDNTLALTFDCTTVVDKERAIDFSIDYVVDLAKPDKAILQNCRFLATRKLMKANRNEVEAHRPVPVAP